jgi:hypothetical protein
MGELATVAWAKVGSRAAVNRASRVFFMKRVSFRWSLLELFGELLASSSEIKGLRSEWGLGVLRNLEALGVEFQSVNV